MCNAGMIHLGCAVPPSAYSHDCPGVAGMDGQSIALLDGNGNGRMDDVGIGLVGGKSEVVLASEADLVDELGCLLADASCGLHGERNEVGVLSGGDVLVLGLLALGGLLSDCEDFGTGYRDMRGG